MTIIQIDGMCHDCYKKKFDHILECECSCHKPSNIDLFLELNKRKPSNIDLFLELNKRKVKP